MCSDSNCSKCNKEVTLNELAKRVQKQVSTLEQLYGQMEKQQELLNEVLSETRKGPRPSKSPFSILENFEFDTEKFMRIAMFIRSVYTDSNKDKVQQEEADL